MACTKRDMTNSNASKMKNESNLGQKFASSVLLGSAAIISAGFVATLFLAPAMLPFGLAAVAAYSMWLKLAITATCSLVSVGSLMMTIGFWNQRAEHKAVSEETRSRTASAAREEQQTLVSMVKLLGEQEPVDSYDNGIERDAHTQSPAAPSFAGNVN